MSAAVYRHFDKSGRLLYVGYSADPFKRTCGHMSKASWALEIASITIEWFPSGEEALAAEKKAIKTECPRENVKDMPDDLFKPRRDIKPRIEAVEIPHVQLDALNRMFRMDDGDWQYRMAKMPILVTNQIRMSGRELFLSEVEALKRHIRTTYIQLEKMGITRRNPG